MRRSIVILIMSIMFFYSYGQNDPISLKVTFKKREITTTKDFNARIELHCNSKLPISIPLRPIIADFHSEYGDIKFRLDKVIDSCYSTVDVTTDFFDQNNDTATRKLHNADTVIYNFDIRRIYHMRKGIYRLKVYYTYLKSSIPTEVDSEWLYFNVQTDKYPIPEDIK